MATSRQEKTYNEIIEYYNYADRLIKAVEDSSHQLANEQFVIVESIVDTLEKHADQLTTQYIEYVKKQTLELCKLAIKNGAKLYYIKKEFRMAVMFDTT